MDEEFEALLGVFSIKPVSEGWLSLTYLVPNKLLGEFKVEKESIRKDAYATLENVEKEYSDPYAALREGVRDLLVDLIRESSETTKRQLLVGTFAMMECDPTTTADVRAKADYVLTCLDETMTFMQMAGCTNPNSAKAQVISFCERQNATLQ